MTAIDILKIQSTLRDRMPRTSQKAFDGIENPLCEQPRTEGASSACIDKYYYAFHVVHYSVGKIHGGKSRHITKKLWKNRRPLSYNKPQP